MEAGWLMSVELVAVVVCSGSVESFFLVWSGGWACMLAYCLDDGGDGCGA